MYYGRIIYKTLEVAPQTYTKSDGTVIFNFNKNEELMKSYGFKPVRETVPPYDKEFERLYQQSLTEDDEYIYLVFGVERLPNVGTVTVDMSNYYTKAETYNRTEIQQLLNNLDIDFAEIQEIQAAYAKIGELDARIANIENANIGELDAMYAEIKELKADVAKIGNLDALYAHIDTLDVDVATIKTLVNGHLTSDNIHSMIITSDKFTVENGFIKNAMIESVNASKINTGILNTNNIQIQSDDGSMLLQGNLQQFKDSNGTVRIQIGKNAQGEFSFCIFDESGVGILIDETGIKDKAIAEGLIVNSMVSDNANISAGKLDINSLFTEINNSGNTIKSSKIYLDEQGQSLQVAFNKLATEVETIKDVAIEGDLSSIIETVSSNTTSINIINGQIDSLIANTTITKENGQVVQLKDEYNSVKDTVDSHTQTIGSLETNVSDVSSKQSKLEQDLNGFRQTISENYTTKSDSVGSVTNEYYVSTSNTEAIGGSWSSNAPIIENGKYIWQRLKITSNDGITSYSTPSCITDENDYTVLITRETIIARCDENENLIQ